MIKFRGGSGNPTRRRAMILVGCDFLPGSRGHTCVQALPRTSMGDLIEKRVRYPLNKPTGCTSWDC
jgi:hypothetical protein